MADFTDLTVASNAYGAVSVFKNLAVLGGLYALAPYLAEQSLWLAWALTPFIGLFIYRLTMVMHDCGHGTLFSLRRANVVVGKFLGFLTGIDFVRFRQRHWEHHKRFGVSGDPQGFHYIGTSRMSRPEFVWHLVKPLLGWNVKRVFSESYLCPENLKTAFANRDFLFILAVQLGVFLLITGTGKHESLVLIPFVGAATFGLFFSQLRGVAEHGIRGTNKHPEGFVRSHPTDWLGKLLLYDTNFNFHEEHHRFPGIPSCHLPKVFEREHGSGSGRPNIWQTLKAMMEAP